MLSHYYTIKQDGQFEIIIKKSRFICQLKRISSEDEAKEIIGQIKKEHWKASHNCVAYVLGDNQSIQRSSDDGEPSGTAGIPMLEVLKVKELHNVLAVVTRYFGGTELGAGGLIRAYSNSVSEALNEIGLVEGKLQQELSVTVDYSLHGKVEHFLENNPNYTLKDTLFTDKVTLLIMSDEKEVTNCQEKLINLLSNQCIITLGETDYVEVSLD
ncbi:MULTISPECIES: YigZ family protein [Vagococcus]|uniref:Protein co-occurring with transport systems (COG1739) n=1 Tax=Vagococcus fluvialis bH819 TaxID=1255619 RepID=A0A1X6WQ79_9ENTE|nr:MULTISPECIES: YigZ family protein [Vagococcus]SLM86430.1 protein co-occurring with transport systems (COG1739) [Vagococcus fluvialis bH819]HCM90638.1 YigZ family protein [Vagococcus sp.]